MAKLALDTPVASPLDPVQMLDAAHRSANMLSAASEVIARTLGEIVAKQADLMRVEGNEIARTAAALASGTEPLVAAQNYAAALRTGADEALTDLREIQDLMRGCAWQLFGLYVDSISVGFGNGRQIH